MTHTFNNPKLTTQPSDWTKLPNDQLIEQIIAYSLYGNLEEGEKPLAQYLFDKDTAVVKAAITGLSHLIRRNGVKNIEYIRYLLSLIPNSHFYDGELSNVVDDIEIFQTNK